jgi:hypothetical protein
VTTAFKTSKLGQPRLATNYSPIALALEQEAFQHPEDINVAVCLLPGTELSFAYEVRRSRLWPWSKNIVHHKTAIFRQVNVDCLHAHHDALEFPDGDMLLLTYLMEGQEAMVLQLPATSSKAPQRAAYVDQRAALLTCRGPERGGARGDSPPASADQILAGAAD